MSPAKRDAFELLNETTSAALTSENRADRDRAVRASLRLLSVLLRKASESCAALSRVIK